MRTVFAFTGEKRAIAAFGEALDRSIGMAIRQRLYSGLGGGFGTPLVAPCPADSCFSGAGSFKLQFLTDRPAACASQATLSFSARSPCASGLALTSSDTCAFATPSTAKRLVVWPLAPRLGKQSPVFLSLARRAGCPAAPW